MTNAPTAPRPPFADGRISGLGAVALGGAVGSSARYGITEQVHVTPHTFPWATFWINVVGCLVLGVVLTLVLERFGSARYLRPFLATGCLGGFTTYSTFAVETNLLVKDGYPEIALTYVGASLSVGLVATWVGIWMARSLLGRPLAVEHVDAADGAHRSPVDER